MLNNIDSNEKLIIRPDEILDAISMLDNNKACGMDHIHAEHYKYVRNSVFYYQCSLLGSLSMGCYLINFSPYC